MPIFQPSPSEPTRLVTEERAPSKKTSLNSDVPVAWMIGRSSMPGSRIGTSRYDRPLCRLEPASVRTIAKPQSAQWASEVQTFCPLMT